MVANSIVADLAAAWSAGQGRSGRLSLQPPVAEAVLDRGNLEDQIQPGDQQAAEADSALICSPLASRRNQRDMP